jgi:hypothetical protein
MEWGGGFVPMEFFVTQVPQFTLYGDGTAVFKPLPQAEGNAFNMPNPAFLTAQLSEDQVQALLAFALHDGHLAAAKELYNDQTIADAGSTMFTIDAGEFDKTVNVYALVESTNDGPDTADRQAFSKLQDRLNNFASEAAGYGPVSQYDPDSYRVTLFDQTGVTPQSGPIDWPWPKLTKADFQASDERPGLIRVMTRDEVHELTTVPNGGQMGIWVNAPDGSVVEFAVRPLLPDEGGNAFAPPGPPAS